MDGDKLGREQALTRCFAGHRLEEQFWTAAYEQLWPVLRATLQRSRPAKEPAPRPALPARRQQLVGG